ncbi:hypothetical protein NQ315_011441 [Exocentrus adspersus]|uniref:Gustatory receptor n=1 Tax=Exocentrus adspersus TaxID=1586481 RepID=A0AAV8VUU1_9CUCU|nr:hypothetical protein NQ315_011441 [Exocentrus adspersus]
MNHLEYVQKLDILILLRQFKMGNVLGLTPIFFDSTKKKRIALQSLPREAAGGFCNVFRPPCKAQSYLMIHENLILHNFITARITSNTKMPSDILNVKILFCIGKILGVTPLWLKTASYLTKIYVTLLTLLVVSGTFLSMNSRYRSLVDLQMSSQQAFLECSECLSELLFMLSCFLGVSCKGKAWNELFQNFLKVEDMFHYSDFKNKGSICVFATRLTLVNLTFFAVHAYEILIWEDIQEAQSASTEYGYILYRISMYYQFFTVYLTFCLTEMLRKRYQFLNSMLEEALKHKCKVVVISNKENQRVLWKLYKIQRVYTTMFKLVQSFNNVFNWILFFYFTAFVTNILVNINYVLKYTKTENGELNAKILIAYVIYSIVYIISTVAIVMSCDGVEQSGKRIAKTCFLYQEVLEKPSFKEELVLFSRFATELAPSFTAAGFFQINQPVLATLFSAVTTYLIIIIQFNMTL